jgi:hypothetical protein
VSLEDNEWARMNEVHFHQLDPDTELKIIKYRAKKELQA